MAAWAEVVRERASARVAAEDFEVLLYSKSRTPTGPSLVVRSLGLEGNLVSEKTYPKKIDRI